MIGYLKNMEAECLFFEIMAHARCLTKLYTNQHCSLLYVQYETAFVSLSYLVTQNKLARCN